VFASDFLQIPLRNGHPCLSLTVPTTKPVTDFHRQDVTHAGRTKKALRRIFIKNHLSAIYFGMYIPPFSDKCTRTFVSLQH
ncbi:hypothetical protein, partial [Staphylococcus felis]|uniref:hypothetical protein n=1 Tax=Staphylococcus felis TaxID=46127 RepID=UPI001EE913C0